MAETSEIKKIYKHFLRFDQIGFEGIEYGFTDLFYDLNGLTLYIKEVDRQNNSEDEFEFPIEIKNAEVETVLEDFLINLMSYSWNFVGEPSYVNSEIFSKDSFDKMLGKGISIMQERYKSAILEGSENELIKYCESIGLNPEPEGGSATNWIANCPSGGQHHIMISTKSNEWGCGYCKKKGDLNSLKEWYKSKNDII